MVCPHQVVYEFHLLHTAESRADVFRYLVACFGEGKTAGEEAGSGGEEGSGDACGTISAVVPTDEDHMLTVTNMDIAEGVDKTYSIQGVSGHNHEVTITAADFVTLAETGSLALTSTETFSHDHIVNVTCEA
jgi:hypothetical protein